jgi:hypothetical protein
MPCPGEECHPQNWVLQGAHPKVHQAVNLAMMVSMGERRPSKGEGRTVEGINLDQMKVGELQ